VPNTQASAEIGTQLRQIFGATLEAIAGTGSTPLTRSAESTIASSPAKYLPSHMPTSSPKIIMTSSSVDVEAAADTERPSSICSDLAKSTLVMHDISSVCIDDVQPDDSVSQTGVDDDPAALEVNKK
jgi:hypothetical protein